MEVDEIDDIFDRNIDQLDVRETPRWELSEEEESAGSDVETLVNQQQTAKQKSPGELPMQEKVLRSIPPSNPLVNSGTHLTMSKTALSPSGPHQQGPFVKVNKDRPVVTVKQPTNAGSSKSGGSGKMGMEKSHPSSKLYRHPALDKEKIDAMVKAAYKEESDALKDFCVGERGSNPLELGKGKPVDNRDKKENQDIHIWEEDDVDSVKDFAGNDRQKEEKYMERTDEVIYQRAAEEHIRRPPLWHDDEVDSVRDFSRVTGKQEAPSGLASQQLSRLPSDEHICLSPPWNEEDDGLVRDFVATEAVGNNFSINNMINEERMRQGQPPPWHEEDEVDSTRDFAAQYRKTRSMENSRRPSEENIYLTPPWMEDERQPCGGHSPDHSSNRQITLAEPRTILEEARNTGVVKTEKKSQALNNEQATSKDSAGVRQPLRGRDSGFSSEQDQLAQQGQGPAPELLRNDGVTCTDPVPTKEILVKPAVHKIQAVLSQGVMPVLTQTQGIGKVPENPFNQTVPKPAAGTVCVSQQPSHKREGPNSFVMGQDTGAALDIRYQNDESAGNTRQIPRSISQSSLEANCYSPHDALDGLETSSVVSFASTAATHHDLDTRIDMVQSLLSMLGTHDKDDMSRTLLAMSNSRDSCAAMRQSGCLPLLINLLHGTDFADKKSRREARARAGLALHNIVYSNVEDRHARREIRVLRLLEIARAHCDVVQFKGLPVHPCAERWYPPLRDYGPGPAIAALMKLSFEEEHRNAICELGGLQAIAELIEIDHQVNEQCKDFYSISLRKYAGMTLTNLTFGNTKNKTLLCSMPGALKAIIAQLNTVEEEEIVQVSASMLRNLSWRADDLCRKALRDAGAIKALLLAAQAVHGEPAMRTTLSALWNLSAHCTDNKTEICASQGALQFLVKCLNYSSPSGNISVVESSGGILRNLSSHIAVRADYRKILRDCGCFHSLLSHLRSPSLRVVSNVCGALWNLSARCVEDQELLWELGAVSLLKSLVNSKHKAISTASAAALRNLMTVKPGSSTDNESISSRAARQYRSMPANARLADAQARVRGEAAKLKNQSPRSQSPLTHDQVLQQPVAVRQGTQRGNKQGNTSHSLGPQPHHEYPGGHSSNLAVGSVDQHKSQTCCPSGQGTQPFVLPVPVTKHDLEVAARVQQPIKKKNGSSASLAPSHSSSSSNHGHEVEPSPTLSRSRSDVGPRAIVGRQRRAKARGADSNSIDSGASLDGRHSVHFKWNQSNDSLTKHRRQPRKDTASKQSYDKTDGDFRQHQRDPSRYSKGKRELSRSSSDGCAVIPLLCDSYPLHVSHNPKKGDGSKDKTSTDTTAISRIKYLMHHRGKLDESSGYLQQQHPGDGMSLVSAATARRLNQWTSKALTGETYEMAAFGPQDANLSQSYLVANQPSTYGVANSSASPSSHKHRAQKFKSYRDSDTELESATDSEEDRTLFGHPRKSSGYPKIRNAWIPKATPETYSPRSADTESIGSSSCSCDHMQNVWIRRSDSKDHKSGGVCGNCSRGDIPKGGDMSVGKKTVKSRRDSSDSPVSSPSVRRVVKGSLGREKKIDPTKRGVKVTSL